jgi:GTP-binding protein
VPPFGNLLVAVLFAIFSPKPSHRYCIGAVGRIESCTVVKVTHAEFLTSAYAPGDYPAHEYPEVVFAGRSNVGKSSLINTLVNRKRLAKTSSSPGKTQSINFYLVNHALCFVDLPGYGYAKVSKGTRIQWRHMVETYLTTRPNLRGAVLIVDAKVGPTRLDLDLWSWLQDLAMPTVIVATKTDKVSRNKLQMHLNASAVELGTDVQRLISFSAATGDGKERLWSEIMVLTRTATSSHVSLEPAVPK